MKKNVVRVFAVTALILALFTNIASASTKTSKRLSGENRFKTAVSISKQGWTTADSIVLTNAYDFPDALSGVTFAYAKNAPILLCDREKIQGDTMAEVERLQAKNIYILGGKGAISAELEQGLRDKHYNVTRLNGDDRFKTAINIGQEIVNINKPDTIFLTYAYNFPDALSVSTFAAQKGYPILFTNKDSLNEDTKNSIQKWGVKNVYILGGEGAVSNNIENTLKSLSINTTRLNGSNRYETAVNIVKQFDTSNKGLTIASGLDFPDALAGSVLAAKENVPIMIYNGSNINSTVADYVKSKANNLYVLGGQGAVSEESIDELQKFDKYDNDAPIIGREIETSTAPVYDGQLHLSGSESYVYPNSGRELEMGAEKDVYIGYKYGSKNEFLYAETMREADNIVLKREYPDGKVERFNVPPVSQENIKKFNDEYDPERIKKDMEEQTKIQEADRIKAKELVDNDTKVVYSSQNPSYTIRVANASINLKIFLASETNAVINCSNLIENPLGDITSEAMAINNMLAKEKLPVNLIVTIMPYSCDDANDGYIYSRRYENVNEILLFNNGKPFIDQFVEQFKKYKLENNN